MRNQITGLVTSMHINCDHQSISSMDVFDVTRIKYDYDNCAAHTVINVDSVDGFAGNDYI